MHLFVLNNIRTIFLQHTVPLQEVIEETHSCKELFLALAFPRN